MDFNHIALARNSDPYTSHDAAQVAVVFRGGHCQRIFDALELHGPSTAHELEARTGLTVVQIDRRLPDLMAGGRATDLMHPNGTDVVRGGARVWQAATDIRVGH